MKIDIEKLKEHVITSFTLTHSTNFVQMQDNHRKAWINHHPNGNSLDSKKRLYVLTKPTISKCANYFEEHVALLENPEEVLGLARTKLSPNEKLNTTKPEMREALTELLFEEKKRFHTTLHLL